MQKTTKPIKRHHKPLFMPWTWLVVAGSACFTIDRINALIH